MRHRTRLPARLIATLAAGLAMLGGSPAAAPARHAASPPGGTGATGGAPIVSGGLAPGGGPHRVPRPPSRHDRGHWLTGVTITEYWPAPESWFVGRLVAAPGLPGLHRIDWLYSATGLSMQGQGVGLDGQMYHLQTAGAGGWVTSAGRSTDPGDGWQAGEPYWRAGGFWRNRRRAVTFPLAAGGWSAGAGRRYVALPGISFAAGASLPLHYYGSIAVDPRVIPLGSRVYVPSYRGDGRGGWFVAVDTGAAINRRHIDVYRPPPASAGDPGRFFSGVRIYVIKPRPGH